MAPASGGLFGHAPASTGFQFSSVPATGGFSFSAPAPPQAPSLFGAPQPATGTYGPIWIQFKPF